MDWYELTKFRLKNAKNESQLVLIYSSLLGHLRGIVNDRTLNDRDKLKKVEKLLSVLES